MSFVNAEDVRCTAVAERSLGQVAAAIESGRFLRPQFFSGLPNLLHPSSPGPLVRSSTKSTSGRSFQLKDFFKPGPFFEKVGMEFKKTSNVVRHMVFDLAAAAKTAVHEFSPIADALLAGSLSPGTITLDPRGDRYLV